MNIDFESLKDISKLVALMEELIRLQKKGTIEKKWMSVPEVATYLGGYSKDKVYKLIQDEWIEGIHYHKPTGRVIIDKNKVDNWIRGTDKHVNTKKIIDDILLDSNIMIN